MRSALVAAGSSALILASCATNDTSQPPQIAQLAQAIRPPEREGPPEPLSPIARALLKERMAAHAQGMSELVSAILLPEYPQIAERSDRTTGVVVLDGIVATPIQRDEAERAVGRLKGLKRLDNRLQISPVAAPDAVAASIRQALNRRAVREAAHVMVRVDDGRVVVEGIVQSREERSAILGAIRGTRGVQAIEDRLDVESEER